MNKIILLGSGSSIGTPAIGCDCDACKNDFRTRFGIYISYNGKNILIDANPDIRVQFLKNGLDFKDIDYIFITHTHYDHFNGLGEFTYKKEIPVYYSDDDVNLSNMKNFDYLEKDEVIKKIPYKSFEEIKLENDIKILPLPLNHGYPTCGFIFNLGKTKIGIMTDTNMVLQKQILDNYKNCDYLFIDGYSDNLEQVLVMYKQIGINYKIQDLDGIWYHSTLDEIHALKNDFNCKNMIAVHICHVASRQEILEKKYSNLIIGRDNLEFEF